MTVYEGKHKLIYICCVVPKVTSPPAQSYAVPNQCYTDKPLSQIFGSDPLSLGAKGTNAPSSATAWQTHSLPLWVQTKRGDWKHSKKKLSTKTATQKQPAFHTDGLQTLSRAELLTHYYYAQKIIIPVKPGRAFISSCASDACERCSHIVTLSVLLTPRSAAWSFVVSGVSGSVTSYAGNSSH